MIEFNDLKIHDPEIAAGIREAVERVIWRGWFVLGPEVEAFEAAFARYHDAGFAVGVANGTDAIELALRALDVGPGDEVITVAHTAVPTVCAVERSGARPVLVDIDEHSFTIDPAAAEAAITPRTRAIVPVHLYGQPADLTRLVELAHRHGLALVEDCAQAHGATYGGRKVGTFGRLAAFSFYPTKNLGALGDGGAVLTSDPELAARLRRLRNYGQTDRYRHVERGVNSRLDEMQAAVLAVRLSHLDRQNRRRRELAACYRESLTGVVAPREGLYRTPSDHVYHLYVVRHPERDRLQASLLTEGVRTLIHYPVPVHRQAAYASLGYGAGSLPVTERVAAEILSLPMYPDLSLEDVRTVARAVGRSAGPAAAKEARP